MKKNLLASTALVAAGVLAANGALAASEKIKLAVGGYAERWVGFASFEDGTTDVNDIDVQEDSEIFFKGSTTLDNGLTFGVNVQLEGQTASDQIDETYIFIKGDFGEIVLGDENGAAYAMHYGHGSNGAGIDSGDTRAWIRSLNGSLLGTPVPYTFDNDSTKIRWISPRMSGFQVGLSYAPENTQDDDVFPTEGTNHGSAAENVMAAGLNFNDKFGSVKVEASTGIQYVGDSNGTRGDDPWTASGGLRIHIGGFRINGAYTHMNDVSGTFDRDIISAGVAYSGGPIGVSLGVVYGEEDLSGGEEDTQVAVELGAKYKLGPGVEARGAIYYANREEGTLDDTSGFAVAGGIKLSF